MKALFVIFGVASLSNAIYAQSTACNVLNPISNTIVTAGETIHIQWYSAHDATFDSIYLVQSDGNQTPIVLATGVPTAPGKIAIELPRTLIPSNAYYMTLGKGPNSCKSGNLRIVGANANSARPTPPGSHNNEISTGTYPKELNDARSKYVLPLTVVTAFAFSFLFMLS